MPGNWMPVALFVAFVLLIGILGGLAATALVKSGERDAEKEKAKVEKTRADSLQKSLNDLEARTGENQKFFDLVRQMLLTRDAAERQALVDQLRGIQFSEATTTTVPSRADPREFPSVTSTTTTSSTTPAPRSPSTTTTTSPPTSRPPPAPPPTLVCVSVPLTSSTICK